MSKLYAYFALSSILFLYACSTPPTCYKVKRGTFYYHYYNANGEKVQLKVIRDGFKQQEITIATKDTFLFNIKWVAECKYELHPVKVPKWYSDSITMGKKPIVTTEILKTTDTYYTFHSGNSISDYAIDDTMWITRK